MGAINPTGYKPSVNYVQKTNKSQDTLQSVHSPIKFDTSGYFLEGAIDKHYFSDPFSGVNASDELTYQPGTNGIELYMDCLDPDGSNFVMTFNRKTGELHLLVSVEGIDLLSVNASNFPTEASTDTEIADYRTALNAIISAINYGFIDNVAQDQKDDNTANLTPIINDIKYIKSGLVEVALKNPVITNRFYDTVFPLHDFQNETFYVYVSDSVHGTFPSLVCTASEGIVLTEEDKISRFNISTGELTVGSNAPLNKGDKTYAKIFDTFRKKMPQFTFASDKSTDIQPQALEIKKYLYACDPGPISITEEIPLSRLFGLIQDCSPITYEVDEKQSCDKYNVGVDITSAEEFSLALDYFGDQTDPVINYALNLTTSEYSYSYEKGQVKDNFHSYPISIYSTPQELGKYLVYLSKLEYQLNDNCSNPKISRYYDLSTCADGKISALLADISLKTIPESGVDPLLMKCLPLTFQKGDSWGGYRSYESDKLKVVLSSADDISFTISISESDTGMILTFNTIDGSLKGVYGEHSVDFGPLKNLKGKELKQYSDAIKLGVLPVITKLTVDGTIQMKYIIDNIPEAIGYLDIFFVDPDLDDLTFVKDAESVIDASSMSDKSKYLLKNEYRKIKGFDAMADCKAFFEASLDVVKTLNPTVNVPTDKINKLIISCAPISYELEELHEFASGTATYSVGIVNDNEEYVLPLNLIDGQKSIDYSFNITSTEYSYSEKVNSVPIDEFHSFPIDKYSTVPELGTYLTYMSKMKDQLSDNGGDSKISRYYDNAKCAVEQIPLLIDDISLKIVPEKNVDSHLLTCLPLTFQKGDSWNGYRTYTNGRFTAQIYSEDGASFFINATDPDSDTKLDIALSDVSMKGKFSGKDVDFGSLGILNQQELKEYYEILKTGFLPIIEKLAQDRPVKKADVLSVIPEVADKLDLFFKDPSLDEILFVDNAETVINGSSMSDKSKYLLILEYRKVRGYEAMNDCTLFNSCAIDIVNDMIDVTVVADSGSRVLKVSPLPSNNQTKIVIPALNGRATLEIHDAYGQKVADLSDKLGIGNTSIVWNNVFDNGNPAISGVYFARLTTGFGVVMVKILINK